MIKELGNPRQLSHKILADYSIKANNEEIKNNHTASPRSNWRFFWLVVIAIITSPITFVLSLGALIVLICALAAVFRVSVGILGTLVGLIFSSGVMIYSGLGVIAAAPRTGILYAGIGVTMIGFLLLCIPVGYWIIRWLAQAIANLAKYIYQKLLQRKAEKHEKTFKVGLGILVIGIVLMVVGFAGHGMKNVSFEGTTPVIEKQVTKKLSTAKEFNRVNLTSSSANVLIKTGSKFSISYQGSNARLPKVTVTNQPATIHQDEGRGIFFSYNNGDDTIIITVPKGTKLAGKLDVADGDLSITNIDLENMDVNIGSLMGKKLVTTNIFGINQIP